MWIFSKAFKGTVDKIIVNELQTRRQELDLSVAKLNSEYDFYKKHKLPFPHLCSNCRYYERFAKISPPKLWHRKCMCNGVESENKEYKNTIEHFHGKNHCQNEFETAISEERKETIYCEKCYQAEFI